MYYHGFKIFEILYVSISKFSLLTIDKTYVPFPLTRGDHYK